MADTFARLNGLRVLIVEDELIIAMELESLLGRLGCIMLDTAPTVRRALRAIEHQQADVAVLDVNLQGERATPLAEALQEQGVPFVLVTACGSDRLPDGALQDAPCLRKPENDDQLASAIYEVLARQEHPERKAAACSAAARKIVEYRYFANFAVAFGEGPAGGVLPIWAGDRLIADLRAGAGAYANHPKYNFRIYRGEG